MSPIRTGLSEPEDFGFEIMNEEASVLHQSCNLDGSSAGCMQCSLVEASAKSVVRTLFRPY